MRTPNVQSLEYLGSKLSVVLQKKPQTNEDPLLLLCRIGVTVFVLESLVSREGWLIQEEERSAVELSISCRAASNVDEYRRRLARTWT